MVVLQGYEVCDILLAEEVLGVGALTRSTRQQQQYPARHTEIWNSAGFWYRLISKSSRHTPSRTTRKQHRRYE